MRGKCEIDASYDKSFDTIFQTHKFDAVVYGIKEDLLLVTPLIEDIDEQQFADEEVADGVDILDSKRYLRPMSSMTDEQKLEYRKIQWVYKADYSAPEYFDDLKSYDWLNKNHFDYRFDYRGLIEKGLAIDATGLNVY